MVLIDGAEFPINHDFRACLRVIIAFEDPELTGFEKQIIMLENLYPDKPDNLQAAFEQGLKFLNCGKAGSEEEPGPRLYSFEKDADLIFAAFRQLHGIDLSVIKLHWWEFTSLFMAILMTDSYYGNLVGLRKRLSDGTATKEEVQASKGMSDLLVIENDQVPLTPEERDMEREFMRLVELGQKG